VSHPVSHYPPSAAKRQAWRCKDCRRPHRRAADARRRARKRETQIDPVDIRLVAQRDGWRCAICGGPVTRSTWSLDHIEPLSHGGPHTYANVALAHAACNSRRGAGRFDLPHVPPWFTT
jgi:5-methylcytosine-specific restriction endonuclease McrA